MKGVGENVKVFVLRSKAKAFSPQLSFENRSTPIFSPCSLARPSMARSLSDG
jgi:hypothetical protein